MQRVKHITKAVAEHFEDLRIWQTARALTNAVYECTNTRSFSEDSGLRDQVQRATVSVTSNIAEGFESRTQSQFLHYLGQAKASAGEVRCQSIFRTSSPEVAEFLENYP